MNLLKFILLSLLLFPIGLKAQIIDDFSDGDLSSNPSWIINGTEFKDTLQQLRSNGPAITPTTIFAHINSTFSSDVQWEFFVNPKCATSSGNFMNIILMSDQNTLNGPFNGYYVMIGNTADEISLYRRDGGVVTKIIDGPDGVVSSSSNNPFKIKVIRDVVGNFTLETDNTGTGSNYTLTGSVLDNTYTNSAFFGVLVTYSAANNLKYFFDDLYIGPIIVDVTAPVIVSATAINATQLDVLFDENLEQTSAETVGNYVVNNGIGIPLTALRDGSNFRLVHLTFATPFTSGQNYQLTVNNVSDLNANAINNEVANFSYLAISTAGYRDVIINEFFPDPSPPIGLPDKEFIELYNRSTFNFNLNGWTFSDGSSTGTIGNFILQSGEFVILCANADVAAFSAFGNAVGLSSWPALNNTGDTIRIRNSGGQIIDQLVYTTSWYQDSNKDDGGWTLELINPTLECSGSSNWIASNNSSGGTPGVQNSVYSNNPDVILPTLLSVSVIAQNQLLLTFSENMDSTSLENAVILLSAPLTLTDIIPLAPDFTQASVIFSPPMDSITAYSITINGGTDCAGNALASTTLSFGIGTPAQKFEILINELYPDPDGSASLPEYEFIELYNRTNKVLSLSGYKISDASTSTTINNAVIFPNSFLIICSSTALPLFQPYGNVISVSSFPSLNNSGDLITLRNGDGDLIHQVNYTSAWYQDAAKSSGGWTLELVDPNNPCGEMSNWRASVDPSGGTPGSINSVNGNNPDNTAPQIILAEAITDGLVIVQFNEIMDSLSMANGIFTINQGISISSQSVYGDRSVLLTLAPTLLQYNIIYTVNAQLCEDCVGNPVSTLGKTFALPQQADPGDLIINEVLFDPRGSGADFVEVYNNSQKIISLKEWALANYSNDTISNHKIITNNVLLIFPGEYRVLTTNPTNIISEYPLGANGNYIQMSSLPTYSNTSGRVILIDNLNRLSDDFAYDDDMHFALLSSVDGVSLERIDFNRPTNDRSNWHSAAESVNFATPGYLNSQYSIAETNSEITITPETFSPDNDGYNDVLTITYQFDQNGMVANMIIYDATGRIEKYLMRNELLGSSGSISWDGINEKREKSSIGIYILMVEVYDINGNLKRYKKAFVLATKF